MRAVWVSLLLTLIYPMPAETGQAPLQEAQRDNQLAPQQTRQAIERGLTFVQTDAAKWRQERSCATCHHGTMTVWVNAEARRHSFEIDAKIVQETNAWAMERLEKIDQPRDERPGWNMVNSPAVYFATMAQAIPDQTVISADRLRSISDHLVRHQEKDGSWAWSLAPAKNRPPPFFESDEVVTRLACMALSPHTQASTAINEVHSKAVNWLKEATATNTTQAAILDLLMRFRDGESQELFRPAVEKFLKRQNDDGGWGQLDDSPSDAYATGQSLYFLHLMNVDHKRDEFERARAFLVTSQKADGSWAMTRRGHPGVTPSDQTIPIVYFGSCWGTLGLLSSLPTTTRSK